MRHSIPGRSPAAVARRRRDGWQSVAALIGAKRALLRVVIVVAAGSLAVAVVVPEARASVSLPPVTTFPAAGDTAPPADAIADLQGLGGSCGDWYLQSSYARQATGSSWWEYACTLTETCPTAPACDG